VIDTPPPPSGVPLVEMIRTILDAGLRVLRGEMSLTRAEIVLALRIAARGLAMIAVAVVAAVLGLVLLAQAAVAGLVALGLAPGWAALIVAAVLLLLAAVLFRFGCRRLLALQILPAQSLRRLRDSAAALSPFGDRTDA
jgi:hypothetical protein